MKKEDQKNYYRLIERFKNRKGSKDLEFIIFLCNELIEKEEELSEEELLLVEKILTISLIEFEDLKEAKNILLRILERYPDDPEALNAMAYLYIKDGHIDEAIKFILDALYFDKENTVYKNNLEKLRNSNDPRIFLSMTEPKEFLYIKLPLLPVSYVAKEIFLKLVTSTYGKIFLVIAGVLILLFIVYVIYPYYINWAENYRFKKGLGKGRVVHLEIKDIEKLVAERPKYQLKLSEDDIKKKFSMIQYYLEEKKVNKAIITINELLNSNADERIKERVLIWKDFVFKLENPSEIDYIPSVVEVLKAPFIYQDAYINWSGTIVNLEHKERKETVFDLLINFVDSATVEGIAEVHFDGFKKVSNGEKVYVFGQISGINLDNHIILKGISIQSFK